MKENEKISIKSRLADKTIIAVETSDDGTRYCHFYAYGYVGDRESPVELSEYTWFILPLEQVIAEGPDTCEGKYGCEYKQYITEYGSVDELCQMYATYNNGQTPIPIAKEQLTAHTPDGMYILCDKEDLIELGLSHSKYVLSASDGNALETSIFNTFAQARAAMSAAFNMVRSVEVNADVDEGSFISDGNAVLVADGKLYLWDITEVRFD